MSLDKVDEIKKMDKDLLVASSIALLPEQIKQVLKDAAQVKIPAHYGKNINKIVVSGMGGSNLGAGIIKSIFSSDLHAPLMISAGYGVPAYVDKNTLYIISSYSGTTEEPLSTYAEAKKRGAKIIAISSRGEGALQKLIRDEKIPAYLFDTSCNPSEQPRIGIGYSVFGMIILLHKVGLLRITEKEMRNTISILEKTGASLTPNAKTRQNTAKKIAEKIYGYEPIYVAAEFLIGNLRIVRNQTCENSKNFASYLTVPELNHYAMEGLAHPLKNKQNLIFILFESSLYHHRIQKRMDLTTKIIKKNKIKAINIPVNGKTKLEQSMEMLQLGTWITYYLGILNQVDPTQIPWVNMFKKELG